jgi:hypothetical protein
VELVYNRFVAQPIILTQDTVIITAVSPPGCMGEIVNAPACRVAFWENYGTPISGHVWPDGNGQVLATEALFTCEVLWISLPWIMHGTTARSGKRLSKRIHFPDPIVQTE